MKYWAHMSLLTRTVCIGLLGLVIAALFIYAFRPRIAWGLVEVGNQFFGGSMPYNLTVANGFYTTALALDPSVPDAWHQRARIAFLHGNFTTALTYINTQIALHGHGLMSSYYIRALIEGYSYDYYDAEKDFLTFLQWDRGNWAANNDLAWIYFSEGKYKEAALRLQGFITTSTGAPNPWLLTMHAMAVYNLGDATTAHKELVEARDAAAALTEADWVHAYPGNDPAIAGTGLASFRATIDGDIALVENKLQSQ